VAGEDGAALREYRRKRRFARTPEPRGEPGPERRGGERVFVVQKHAASRLHYDFRLELEGVLKSWAVPKGPSLDPADKRLAMHVEDHPLEYGDFEGVIPKGEYGGGTVMLWDRGTWQPEGDPHRAYRAGNLKFTLAGEKLRGGWALVRIRDRRQSRDDERSWLLIKHDDAEARPSDRYRLVEARPESVATGRTLEAIASARDRVWHSDRSDGARGAAVSAAEVAGARAGALPRFVPPQLATLVARPPAGDAWLHEMKFDGYRILARLEQGRVTLSSRSGRDWTDRFPTVADSVRALPVRAALLDGEVAVVAPDGRTSFQALQGYMSGGGHRDGLVYLIFDLLHLDGQDLTGARLEDRKALLARLLGPRGREPGVLRYSDHVVGSGAAFFAEACRLGLEGAVSKRRDAPYRSTRGGDWRKTKCVKRQEVVIGGYTDPEGSRPGIGALLAGVYEGGRLVYVGKVGTGFTARTLRALRARLEPLERPTSPFATRPAGVPRPHWVEPRLVAEVAFGEWTEDGKMRHPSFQGLREDKPADQVVRERPARER
jgi:bifunctional non-homologous end joining protein LigD